MDRGGKDRDLFKATACIFHMFYCVEITFALSADILFSNAS